MRSPASIVESTSGGDGRKMKLFFYLWHLELSLSLGMHLTLATAHVRHARGPAPPPRGSDFALLLVLESDMGAATAPDLGSPHAGSIIGSTMLERKRRLLVGTQKLRLEFSRSSASREGSSITTRS